MLEDFTLSSHAITSRFRTDPPIDTSFFDISARSFSTFPHKKIVHFSNLSSFMSFNRILDYHWWIIFRRFGFFFTILNIPTSLYPLIFVSTSICIILSIIISQLIFHILPSNVSIFILNLCSFCVSPILKTLIMSICRFLAFSLQILIFTPNFIFIWYFCVSPILIILISFSNIYYFISISISLRLSNS